MTTAQATRVYNETEYAVVSVTDDTTTVFTGPCTLHGIYVNTTLSAHVLPVTDGSTTVVSLDSSTAVGTNINFPGIRFETSLIVNPDDAGTGRVTVAFRKANNDR